MNAADALNKVKTLNIHSILDIGCGTGQHAKDFSLIGKHVLTVSLIPPADIVGNYLDLELGQFDLIWASHVLEHQLNPHIFLKKCFNDLKPDGYIAITVPPLKHEIVGGHVSLWNAGILLYHLILAGFDCSNASVKTYDYNISVIVQKKPVNLPELVMDFGDIERLSPYFPMEVKNGFDGRIKELNW